jgi:hypothetical protein
VRLPLMPRLQGSSETALRVNSQNGGTSRVRVNSQNGGTSRVRVNSQNGGTSRVRLVRLIKPKVEKWCAG